MKADRRAVIADRDAEREEEMIGVRRSGAKTIRFGIAALAVTALAVSSAQAASVKDIFEKYNLLGTFAWDCTQPASKDNDYYVDRLLDADHVQRDRMTGPTTRASVTILDKAAELKPNEIAVSGSVDGNASDGVWRVEPTQMLQWEATIAGKKIIGEGRLLSTKLEMPKIHKCDALQPIRFNLAGHWKSEWGAVTIEVAANDSMSGSWVQKTGTGVLNKGVFDPRAGTLVFAMFQPWDNSVGTASFTLSQDGSALKGTWRIKRMNGSEDHGPWTLTR